MRLAYLIDGLGMGGAERLLVPYLRYLVANGFQPRVCALQERQGNPMAREIAALGIPVDLLPVSALREVTAVPRIMAYLRQHRIQLVHTQLELANSLGTVAAKWLRLPTVCTLHTFDDPPQGSKSYRRIRLMWWVLRHFSDQIVAVSEETRQHHLRLAKFAPQQVQTLYNGIDLALFSPTGLSSREAVRGVLGIPVDALLLTTVAVLREPKGIQFMIEGLTAVLQTIPCAYYLVVGDGDYGPALRQQAQHSGVAERVVFAGQRSDIADFLAASDLFVLPTLGDALPTVLAEAMALSLPLVACAVGGVPEMVTEGYNGLLVPPANAAALAAACLRLLQDRELAQRLGHNGRLLVEEKFNITRQAQQLGELYRRLVG